MKKLAMCIVMSALAACSSAPTTAVDEPRALQPDEGIAAVVLDAPARIQQVQFAPRFPGGSSFEVPDTQGGATLYLVPVKAGRYCLQHFFFNGGTSKSETDVACFTVIAGHITYTGNIVPWLQDIGEGKSFITVDEHHQPAMFMKLLQASYPKMAAAYPLAAPPPVPPGVEAPSSADELGFWYQNGDDRSQTLNVQNNTAWRMKITRLKLYDSENLAQACSDSKLDLDIGPFETRKIMTFTPADQQQNYTYRFQYWDENAQ
ncbi:MAG TPA: hypothetical protein VGM47_06440 [Gammaproteobacteria bacterium]|jgi:hypothetical protein